MIEKASTIRSLSNWTINLMAAETRKARLLSRKKSLRFHALDSSFGLPTRTTLRPPVITSRHKGLANMLVALICSVWMFSIGTLALECCYQGPSL